MTEDGMLTILREPDRSRSATRRRRARASEAGNNFTCQIDFVLISDAGGLFLTGWVDDRSSLVRKIRISGVKWSQSLGSQHLGRSRRCDVDASLGISEERLSGIWALASVDPVSADEDVCSVELMLSDGTSSSSEVKLQRRAAEALKDQVVDFLESLEPGDLLVPTDPAYMEQILEPAAPGQGRHRLRRREADPSKIQAHLEFASAELPNTYILAGWVIHECRSPIRWGVLARETYHDISNAIVLFPRSDLETDGDSCRYNRSGFFALVEGGRNLAGVQLTIGLPENPTKICLPLSDCDNTELSSYFARSHQLLRFSIAERVSTLPQADADGLATVFESVLKWIQEVSPLEGSLHHEIRAGIDHAIYTPGGDCYVEGWLHGSTAGHFNVSASLIGVHASRTLLQPSVFRRPDIGGGIEFSGFTFLAQSRLTGKRDPTLLLQARHPDSADISYRKVALRRCSPFEFGRIFWSRCLDVNSINPDALCRIWAFTRGRAASAEPTAKSRNESSPKHDAGLSALVLDAPPRAALRNLLILTFPLAHLGFSETVLISANGMRSEVWWPNAHQMMTFSTSRSLDEALPKLKVRLALVLDACSMTKPDFVADVRAAEQLLEERPEVSFVILTDEQFVGQKPSRDHMSLELQVGKEGRRVWLNLSKGQATLPMVARTELLHRHTTSAWPQPSPAATLRRFMREEGQRGVWLETPNVAVFYSRPSVSNLPDDFAAVLLRLDAGA
jgi:hypothetical protein